MILSRRRLLSLSAAAGVSSTLSGGLAGCGAVSAVSRASDPLDAYTLSSLPAAATRGGGRGHLVIELPTTGGELSSDRILIKASPLQAEYLPGARWTEPVPAMVQTLLVNSALNQGGFRLVSRVGAGLLPDHTLMTEIQAFQAELPAQPISPSQTAGPGVPVAVRSGLVGSRTAPLATQVRVVLQMTVIREQDRAIAGTRRFTGTRQAVSDSTDALVANLDNAMQTVLREAMAWVRTVT